MLDNMLPDLYLHPIIVYHWFHPQLSIQKFIIDSTTFYSKIVTTFAVMRKVFFYEPIPLLLELPLLRCCVKKKRTVRFFFIYIYIRIHFIRMSMMKMAKKSKNIVRILPLWKFSIFFFFFFFFYEYIFKCI